VSRTKNSLTRERRKEQTQALILEAATELFLKAGPKAVNINQLVKETGGSKETVYKHFGNKDGLILAIIDNELLAATKYLDDLEFEHMELRPGLEYIGISILETITTERFLSFDFLVKKEALTKPELGQKFYDHLSARSYKMLANYFKIFIDKGELKNIQPQRLAKHFWAMMLHNLYLKLEFQAINGINKNQIRRHVKRTVDDFLLMTS
jgi:TetR/AcrR family transcriptional repressor of mexJK operon